VRGGGGRGELFEGIEKGFKPVSKTLFDLRWTIGRAMVREGIGFECFE